MKKLVFLGLISILCLQVNGQFIDNYGLKYGAGLSNQYWDYKIEGASNLSAWKGYKVGFIGQVYAEKNIGKYLSFRPAIGYIQKGFLDEITLITADFVETQMVHRVVSHDVSLDMSLKVIPFETKFKPYVILGLRGDYLLNYHEVLVGADGDEKELNTGMYEDLNKFTLGGIIGLGVSCKDFLCIDLDYNPNITKNFKSGALEIKDTYLSLTMGININQLVK